MVRSEYAKNVVFGTAVIVMELTFSFPYKPYPIQEKFMKELYCTLESHHLGIFESPTGTGKSLSVCCSSLQWLKNFNKKTLIDLEKQITQLKLEVSSSAGDSRDWLQEEYEKIKKNQTLVTLQQKLDMIKKQEQIFNEMRLRVAKEKSNVTKKTHGFYFPPVDKDKKRDTEIKENDENVKEGNEEDRDLILDEYEEKKQDSEEDETEESVPDNNVKIYISSRTHSQLSQFIGEIKKTVFNDNTKVVTLASRQHYCINSEVTRLKNVNLINERCLDLQKSKSMPTSVDEAGRALKKTKTKSCTACPYYNQSNVARLKDRILVDIMDMEDLVKCGKELKACPYYASRIALDDAEVVLISHAGIMSSGARSGISLKLQNNILILDEAHGLTAALENAHSAPVSIKQLSSVQTYLQFYINKYRARLSSKNLLALSQLNFVVRKLLGIIKLKPIYDNEKSTIFTLEDFVIKAEIDHINLRPLIEFCKTTKLAPKLHGFSMRYNQQSVEEEIQKSVVKNSSLQSFLSNISKKKTDVVEVVKAEEKPNIQQTPIETSAGSGLYAVLEFLERLCDRSENGRVLAYSGDEQTHTALLKYLLLNPAEHFAEVVTQCRSVIVAGGTMEPINEFKALLTSGTQDAQVNVVKCDHVVPPENVLGVCLSKGPSNIALNFSYENRMSSELLTEVGRILRNICSIVPGGVVCFLPSYSYEETVYKHLKNTKIIDAISKKKTVFREPKSASDVDQVLHKFAVAVKSKDEGRTGALLLSVVGGKLSEGLNFSDDLGRCVMVVGMPYPNVKSPELQEKMSYLNRTNGPSAGNQYYENLCMKAVNQCIGRAVRHANDYACVLLVDERYSRPQTVSALPSFVQKSVLSNCNFGPTIGSIAKFFSRHKTKTI